MAEILQTTIRRLGVPVRSRYFLSQKLWHFQKDIRSCVENECCCPRTVNISNVNFISKYLYRQSKYSKTWNSICLALFYSSNGSSIRHEFEDWVPLRSRHFLSQKLWHFHKDIRSCVENEYYCPHTVNISSVNFTSKIRKHHGMEKLSVLLAPVCEENPWIIYDVLIIDCKSYVNDASDGLVCWCLTATSFSTLRPRPNGRHLADNIFKYIYLNTWIFIFKFTWSLSWRSNWQFTIIGSDNGLVPTRG